METKKLLWKLRYVAISKIYFGRNLLNGSFNKIGFIRKKILCYKNSLKSGQVFLLKPQSEQYNFDGVHLEHNSSLIVTKKKNDLIPLLLFIHKKITN